jgi:hypothetical protein
MLRPHWTNCSLISACSLSYEKPSQAAGHFCWEERMEHRHEPRKNERLVVTVDGRDKTGHFFNEQVVASRISKSGALLSGLSRHVRLGDVISVAYGGKKSRFKVVWLRDSESHHLIQAAIHLMKAESCPWGH